MRLFQPYPTYGIFWVTQNCNFRCRHCFNHEENLKQNDDLSLDEIEKVSSNLKNLPYLSLAGGEPFLRQDLADIVRIFYRQNKVEIVNIVTNGWLHDRIVETAQSLLTDCPKLNISIAVSLDGMEEHHDRIRQKLGSFRRCLESLQALKEVAKGENGQKLSVFACGTYNKENAHDLLKLSTFLAENDQIPLFINLIRTRDVLDNSLLEVNIEHYRKVATQIQKTSHALFPTNYPFRKSRMALDAVTQNIIYQSAKHNHCSARCQAGKKGFVLCANGDMLLCEILGVRLGNVRDNNYAPYRILASKQAQEKITHIRMSRCHCTWECFQRLNVIYSPSLYPSFLWQIMKLI